MPAQEPEFVLFGDSLTEWSFDEHNEGFGWYLERKYQQKAQIHNEGTETSYSGSTGMCFVTSC